MTGSCSSYSFSKSFTRMILQKNRGNLPFFNFSFVPRKKRTRWRKPVEIWGCERCESLIGIFFFRRIRSAGFHRATTCARKCHDFFSANWQASRVFRPMYRDSRGSGHSQLWMRRERRNNLWSTNSHLNSYRSERPSHYTSSAHVGTCGYRLFREIYKRTVMGFRLISCREFSSTFLARWKVARCVTPH